MANKHETLASLFTDTADAIREKTGTSEKIIADNFPDVIREISVGIDTSDATIEPYEVMNNEIAYGVDGKIIGTAPFECLSTTESPIMPFSANWKSITYGDGKFVAVANDDGKVAYSLDGIEWIPVTSSASIYYSWSSVTYGGGKFVAVSQNSNKAMYSTDGINWFSSQLTAAAHWETVTYGNGKFVAMAGGEYSSSDGAYSEDGITWTSITLPYVRWQSVVYGNNKFVAVTDGVVRPYMAYSEDGINWTQNNNANAYWKSITYGDGKFVAIAGGNSIWTDIAAYSEDGINWTFTTLPVATYWSSVTYGNGKFIAIAGGGLIASKIAYSEDGITWREVLPPSEGIWYSATYGNDKFVATPYGSNKAMYSIDGINWFDSGEYYYRFIQLDPTLYLEGDSNEKRKLINTSLELKFEGDYNTSDATIEAYDVMKDEIAYGKDGKIVGIAPFKFNGAVSEVGTQQTELPTSANWTSIAYGNNTFVAIASGNNIVAHSVDGVNWTQSSLPSSISWISVTYGDGKFVAVANNSTITAYSADGVNWTQSLLPISANWSYITYGIGNFIIVSSDKGMIFYSSDAINWNLFVLPRSEQWSSMAYGDGKVVAIARTCNVAACSTNVTNWTQTTMPTIANWSSVVYGDGKFVAIASGSNIMAYSVDGTTWIQAELPISAEWNSITYGNGMFVAVASNSNIMISSTDGLNWTQIELPVSANWYSVAYGNGKFIAVAYNNSNIAAYCEVEEVSVYKLIETTTLSADNCEPRKLYVENGEIVTDAPKTGQYVWKQLTAEGGDFISYVVSDDENSYPDGAMLDGYWYEFYKVLTQSKTVTPKASSQTVTPDEGFLLDSVVIEGDADLVAKNIRKGTNIFGITGTLVAGVSGMECGTVTISANASSITINHNLGVAPSKAYLFNSTTIMDSNTTMNMNGYAFGRKADVATYGSVLCKDSTTLTKTKTAVTFPQNGTKSYAKWLAGTYYWLVVK